MAKKKHASDRKQRSTEFTLRDARHHAARGVHHALSAIEQAIAGGIVVLHEVWNWVASNFLDNKRALEMVKANAPALVPKKYLEPAAAGRGVIPISTFPFEGRGKLHLSYVRGPKGLSWQARTGEGSPRAYPFSFAFFSVLIILVTMILDGRMVAASVHEYIRKKITEQSANPHLAVILVGDNPASESYIRMKERACESVGIAFSLFRFQATVDEESVLAKICEINTDPSFHGILVQSPLPSHFVYRDIVETITPEKDVDGFTRTNIGNLFLGDSSGLVSCTPKGIKKLLEAYKIEMEGKHVVIVGRSNIVGKPMALIGINAGATVTSCNSRTRNLGEITKTADILIVATGRIGLITRDMVRPETVVIDVGSTFLGGRALGDADFANLENYVSAISPVPGGVGPMTVAMVVENTWRAYEIQQGGRNRNEYTPAVSFRHQSEV